MMCVTLFETWRELSINSNIISAKGLKLGTTVKSSRVMVTWFSSWPEMERPSQHTSDVVDFSSEVHLSPQWRPRMAQTSFAPKHLPWLSSETSENDYWACIRKRTMSFWNESNSNHLSMHLLTQLFLVINFEFVLHGWRCWIDGSDKVHRFPFGHVHVTDAHTQDDAHPDGKLCDGHEAWN